MKRTGCPDRSCPRELRAKGAGVQYVHRFDHTCRIVSFPVGKRYDFGFADSRAFCFCAGRARRIAPTRVWRFCTAPPLPRFAFRTGSASFHAAVRDPNRFSSPAQVRAGRAGPFRTPPQSPAAAPAASFAQRARLCAEPVRVPGPGPSGTQTGFLLPYRSAPAAQDPSAACPRVRLPRRPRPLRNGRAFAPNRYGSPGPDRLDPVPPFSLCAAPFVTVFFSRCSLIFPACLIDGRK